MIKFKEYFLKEEYNTTKDSDGFISINTPQNFNLFKNKIKSIGGKLDTKINTVWVMLCDLFPLRGITPDDYLNGFYNYYLNSKTFNGLFQKASDNTDLVDLADIFQHNIVKNNNWYEVIKDTFNIYEKRISSEEPEETVDDYTENDSFDEDDWSVSGELIQPEKVYYDNKPIITNKPFKVYHGSKSKFDKFDNNRLGLTSGADPFTLLGYHFALGENSKNVAKQFAQGLYSNRKNSRGGFVYECELPAGKYWFCEDETEIQFPIMVDCIEEIKRDVNLWEDFQEYIGHYFTTNSYMELFLEDNSSYLSSAVDFIREHPEITKKVISGMFTDKEFEIYNSLLPEQFIGIIYNNSGEGSKAVVVFDDKNIKINKIVKV